MRELFLTSFGGMQYGIWKDEILSVRDLHALHRIPLSPARIAGILIDDGQTVVLADLSVCLGYESSAGIGQGSILLMAEGEKVRGFALSGEIHTQSVPTELLFRLPDYLKTQVFDTCAIHDGIPIPVINIAELYSRVLKAGEEPSMGSFRIPVVQPQDISGTARIRFVVVGGELFAVSAAGIDGKAVKPGLVTPLPDTPQYVKGVTLCNGRLLPVIDLSQRIKRQSGAPESLMLVAEIGGAAFGLLIDDNGVTLSAEEVTIKPVPLIAQTLWLKDVVVREGEIIPLVDLAMALSPDSGAGDEKPIWQRYTPGSGFPDLFAKHDVEVVEFSLLGERHALPKEEVEDVIAFKSCRAIPDVPSIVIGVAEHDGEILPVVDLAMMFGRRSLTTPAWRMMLVKNGTFRALVITEAVFGERRLPLEIQNAVPIQLPHDLMYGCYPDADAVRLILNVEAISVHFEKSLIQKFLPALSHGMKKLSMEVEPIHEVASVAALSSTEPEALAAQEQASGPQRADGPAPEIQQRAEEDVESIEEQEAISTAPAIVLEPEPGQLDVAHAASSSATIQEPLSSSGEWCEWDKDEALEDEELVAHAEAVPEEPIEPETISSAAEPPELTAPLHNVATQEPFDEGNKAYEPVVMIEQSPREEFIASALNDSAAVFSQSAQKFRLQTEVEDAELIEEQEAEAAAPEIPPEPESEPEQMDVVRAAVSSASTQESQSIADEMSAGETLEQEHVPPAATVSEITITPETIAKAAIPSEPTALLHSVSSQQLSGESTKAREPVVMSEQPPVELLKAPAQKEPAQIVLATASSQEAPLQAKPGGLLLGGAAVPAPDTSRPSEPVRAAASATRSGPYRTYHEEPSVWKSRIVYGALAAVLVAAVYFAGTSHIPDVEKSVKVIEPAKIEQAKARTEPVKANAELVEEKAEQAKIQAEQDKLQAAQAKGKAKAEQSLVLSQEGKAQTEPPRPAEKLRTPLELDIPKNMPVGIDVYVVVKGDTLWSISERFTGNPYNYPRIAGENRIADPDLIFPGQTIRLIK